MNPKLKADYADVYKKTQIGWQFLVIVWIIVAIADRAGMLSNILAGILVFVLFYLVVLPLPLTKHSSGCNFESDLSEWNSNWKKSSRVRLSRIHDTTVQVFSRC